MAGAKLCISTVTGIGFSLTGGMGGLKGKLFAAVSGALHRRAFRNCNKVIFQNADDMRVFLEHKLLPEEKAILIQGSGVDMSQNHPSERKPHEGPVRFVFLSRLIAPKGIYELVEATKRLHEELPGKCEVVLAGATDPQNPKSITESELLEWVRQGILKYVGVVPNAVAAFESADVAVLPSYWLEGLPRSMVEAAAMGLPVITTTSSGCRDSVVDGVTGFAVPPKDAEALLEAMKKLANDQDLRTKMGLEGRKFVENRYSVEAVLEQTWRVYESAI
jgi:glycosyltransferase involved in cell wall biosynthesis